MFEKSLYDLIRGLRHHRGNEGEYIRNSLRECRTEIRGPDLDLKATALLKLIYLEMFGHDMSWASFHVLEVMSSAKYGQKRVGYLAAAQSFRPDTDVLMLATNLLKKDVASAVAPTITLPLLTIPHVITLSLADSLVTDILPRLSHSNSGIRKKAVATIYRIALVYPDALKFAWPKMHELLMDDEQDPSVAAAVINVICELGWRRPHDFLSLAPRLLEFLVEGGNNWMAIKIIKLFASLTRTENRLIKKLVGPLINLIHTTPAMSLLYECINGIIEGGFLVDNAGTEEADEIASLCVQKLRGMIIVDGDPNLKYVSLLAFNKIIASHSHLVTSQEDVILACLDDEDISIRLKALELASEMISSENLAPLVDRLISQLRNYGTRPAEARIRATNESFAGIQAESVVDLSEQTDPEIRMDTTLQTPLAIEYRHSVGQFILLACSKDNYANIVDFEWFIDVLLCLLRYAPDGGKHGSLATNHLDSLPKTDLSLSVHAAVGRQLRNVAVRVEGVRRFAIQAAQEAITLWRDIPLNPSQKLSKDTIVEHAVWIIGEFISECADVQEALNLLLNADVRLLSAPALCSCVQAIPKVLSHIIVSGDQSMVTNRQASISNVTIRVVSFIENLTDHPDLEVQERAVGFCELLRLGHSAMSGERQIGAQGQDVLVRALPQLFSGSKLNPVAPSAQGKISLSSDLDLGEPINPNLNGILSTTDKPQNLDPTRNSAVYYYRSALSLIDNQKIMFPEIASEDKDSGHASYTLEDAERRLEERRMKHLEDPFHLQQESRVSRDQTILSNAEKESIDIDSIPIISLEIGSQARQRSSLKRGEKLPLQQKYTVAKDETIGGVSSEQFQDDHVDVNRANNLKYALGARSKPLLAVDSTEISRSKLTDTGPSVGMVRAREESQDLEMAKALAEVERLRLEMQRTTERVEAIDDVPMEGTFVKKKIRRSKKSASHSDQIPFDASHGQASGDKKKKVRIKKKVDAIDETQGNMANEEHLS